MKLKGLTIDQLSTLVARISRDQYSENIIFKRDPDQVGNFLHFTLTVINSAGPGAKRSPRGRRIAALCWHGHRDIMRAIFNAFPDSLLITALARYEGQKGFEHNFPKTGFTNIGSIAEPFAFRNACECNHQEY